MYRGAIFDLDGTILDSNHIWDRIDQQFLENHHLIWDEIYASIVKNMDYASAAEAVIKHYQLPNTTAEIMHEWESLAEQEYCLRVKMKNDVFPFMNILKEKVKKFSLVTFSPTRLCFCAMERLKIKHYFNHIELLSEIRGHKTRETYERVCRLLKVKPQECLGFEDNLNAAIAMRETGIKVYTIRDFSNERSEILFKENGFLLLEWKEIKESIKNIN